MSPIDLFVRSALKRLSALFSSAEAPAPAESATGTSETTSAVGTTSSVGASADMGLECDPVGPIDSDEHATTHETPIETMADAAFDLLKEVLDARRDSICTLKATVNGRVLELVMVDQRDSAAPVVSKKSSPVKKRAHESPVVAPVSNGVKKQRAETSARFKLTAERIEVLKRLFDAHKSATDSPTFKVEEFLKPEATKEALKEFYDHYNNAEDGARKFKSALQIWFGKHKKGELVFTSRGKPKQKDTASDDDV